MALFRSTKAGSPEHSHIILLGPEGTGATTENEEHSHRIDFMDPPAPGVDTRSAGPIWSPGPDGHVHAVLNEEPRRDEEPDEPEVEVVSDVIRLFRTSRDFEHEAREFAVESEEFYRGEQWDPKDKKALESQSRAALTLNEIEPKIDLISGYLRQNRTDIKYLPVEEGDQRVVDILNTLSRNILDQTNYEFEETQTFEDGIIAGRGFFHVYIDHDRDPLGEIVVETFPWPDVYLGPHKRADMKDCEYLIKAQWFSEAKLKQMFPDKAKEIVRDLSEATGLRATDDDLQPKPDGYAHEFESGDPRPAPLVPTTDLIDIAKKEFLLLECWRREYKRVPTAIVRGQPQSLYGWTDAEASDAEQFGPVIDRKIDRMRVTKVVGSVMLEDLYDETYGDGFPIIAFYAKKRDDLFWGKVHPAKDAQREINKRHSQMVDILNKVAAYGWFYDGGIFPDQSTEQKFKDNAAVPGFTLKVSDVNKIPVQVEGVKYPNEIGALEEISTTKLREIMNINPELLGLDSKAESGVAQIEKKRQGLIGNEFLWDNLNLAKKQLGRLLIRMIQQIYTPERIMRVIGGQATRGPMDIGGQPYDQQREQELVTLLRTSDLSKYDVAVSDSAHSPTQRRANFVAWAELAGKGLPVPPALLVQLSDLEDKDKVIEAMVQQAQQEMELEKMKIQAEVQKTIISSQGGNTPQGPAQ